MEAFKSHFFDIANIDAVTMNIYKTHWQQIKQQHQHIAQHDEHLAQHDEEIAQIKEQIKKQDEQRKKDKKMIRNNTIIKCL